MPADKIPHTFKPEAQTEAKAKRKLRGILLQSSFMERWMPVMTELNWVLDGRPAEVSHKKMLPDYCYNILELHRRTLFKSYTPCAEVVIINDPQRAATCKTVAEAKQCLTVDFAKMGAVFAMGERCPVNDIYFSSPRCLI